MHGKIMNIVENRQRLTVGHYILHMFLTHSYTIHSPHLTSFPAIAGPSAIQRSPLPGLRPKRLTILEINNLPDGRTRSIDSPRHNTSTPVVGHPRTRKLHEEEEENSAQRETDVESGRRHVIVLHPPSQELASDVLVENEADHHPGELYRC